LDFTLRVARQRTAFIPLPPAGPRDRDVSIRADTTTARGSVVLYKGNVEMKTDSVIVRADELDFDSTTQQADARGNVRIQVLPINARVLPLAEQGR
jgi:lipopolysaccharide assembly outer membrane protein LptD (OstA)